MSQSPGWPPDYSFLAEAAEEARQESRRHWVKGGEADRKYPMQPVRYWKIDEARAHEETVAASMRRMRGEKK